MIQIHLRAIPGVWRHFIKKQSLCPFTHQPLSVAIFEFIPDSQDRMQESSWQEMYRHSHIHPQKGLQRLPQNCLRQRSYQCAEKDSKESVLLGMKRFLCCFTFLRSFNKTDLRVLKVWRTDFARWQTSLRHLTFCVAFNKTLGASEASDTSRASKAGQASQPV